ncbi:MAG: hypothetical protein OXE46_02935 [Chloroflexi bacterium]|nr:hypothetical protein [Chloroflexota bacterium]
MVDSMWEAVLESFAGLSEAEQRDKYGELGYVEQDELRRGLTSRGLLPEWLEAH